MSAGLRAGDSQVAAAAGVNLQTLRCYERRGLLDPPERTLCGHRVQPDQAITLLRAIKTAQRLGFSLARPPACWKPAPITTAAARRACRPRRGAKIVEIDRKIKDLTVIRESRVQAIDAGCDDIVACAGGSCCPLPFVELVTTRPGGARADA